MTQNQNTKEEIIADCDKALLYAPSEYLSDLTQSDELVGATKWYSFESKVWKIGEEIRQKLLKNPKLKHDKDIFDKFIFVIQNRNLRRGRQSFVLLLGFKGASHYADEIAHFLIDPDIAGHALDTLLKMKVAGYTSNVEPLLESKQTWIRNKAKTYVEKYQSVHN